MSEEVVPHNSNTVPQIAEFVDGIDALKDPVTRRDYFEHMDADSFIDTTQQVASLVRTGDSDQKQYFDGLHVGLMGHEVPDQREKEDLLRETWDVAQGFLKNRNIEDKDALEYAALTVAGGILLAHPFADGNGRTSRVLSFLISEGGEDAEALEAMVSHSLSTEWQVAPSNKLFVRDNYQYTSEQPKEIEWEFQFAGEAEDALGGAVASTSFSDQIVRRFIDTADDQARRIIETCAKRDSEGRLLSVDGDKLLEVLTNDPERGIEYAQKLLDLQRVLRADKVRRYLKAMKSDTPRPIGLDPHKFTDSESYDEKFRGKVRTMAGIVAVRAADGKMLARDEAVVEHRGFSDFHSKSKA